MDWTCEETNYVVKDMDRKMKGRKCDRCGRETLELYHVLVPNLVIGDTRTSHRKCKDFQKNESVCYRCLEALKKKWEVENIGTGD